jgi:PIN domain nuclease of toxin-antitoxin system
MNLGKLEIKIPLENLESYIRENNFKILPIKFSDLIMLSNLHLYHRDPFDRLLIAQSLNDKMNMISRDKIFKDYNVVQIW